MKFECDRCGRCCRSFGEFIRIERQLSTRDYYFRFGITHELFLAHTEPEYADEIAEEYEQQEGSGNDTGRKKCIFLQEDRRGDGFTCAIYQNRPSICREFQCYRMVIYDQDRHAVGTVIGRNELKTFDENLAKIWEEKIAHLPVPASHSPLPLLEKQIHPDTEAHIHGSHRNDSVWAEPVIAILKTYGYYGDSVE